MTKNSYKIIVLIMAAGRGERFLKSQEHHNTQNIIPKQYRKIKGISLVRKTIEVFLRHSAITDIAVVINPDHKKDYDEATKGLPILPPIMGGKTRQISVKNGLNAIKKHHPKYVLIHDGARPQVTQKLLDRLLQETQKFDAVIPALPITDTVKKISADLIIEKTLPREKIWRAQTPQLFAFSKIYQAHIDTTIQNAPDDSYLWEEFYSKKEQYSLENTKNSIKIIEGEEQNIKVTHFEDMKNLDTAYELDAIKIPRIGSGFDVHAFESTPSNKGLTLCGTPIAYPFALEGHSDADVALHAITDALFGALSMRDIGTYFPPHDPQWKNKDSAVFLQFALDKLYEKKGEIVNLDLTLICEEPKISEHHQKMIIKLSELMRINLDQVSIKATTTEKKGFLGRKEGIAAHAVIMIIL